MAAGCSDGLNKPNGWDEPHIYMRGRARNICSSPTLGFNKQIFGAGTRGVRRGSHLIPSLRLAS